jgi:DNA polymerase-3 subunit epsilon
MRQIILDTETTGLLIEEDHRIIEIACVEMINRKLTGKRFHTYLNPERDIDAGARAVHGITNDFLQDKPIFAAIAEEMMNFIQGAELIIHNAPFDVGFINHELSKTTKRWKLLNKYCRITDTLLLARQLHVGQRNSLDALCKRYGIDNSERELHGALLDAHLLARVYLAMTGGQGSLFDEMDAEEASNLASSETEDVRPNRTFNLAIIQANSAEITAHNEYLQSLTAKGKCLWSSLE